MSVVDARLIVAVAPVATVPVNFPIPNTSTK